MRSSRSYCDFPPLGRCALACPRMTRVTRPMTAMRSADDRRHHLGHGFGVAFFAVFFAGAFLAGAFLAGTSGAPSRTGSGNGEPSRFAGSAKLM
jgi:hypothetical protein